MSNIYELLYMIRMKNAAALEELFHLCRRTIDTEINTQISRYRGLSTYREDLLIEAQVGLLRAAEYYRCDQGCTFISFAGVIVHRRIVQAAKHCRLMMGEHGMYPMSLNCTDGDDAVTFSNLIPSRDRMSDPVFRLHFNEAARRMKDAEEKLSDREREVFSTWAEGGTYLMKAEKLGMTYRQYEGRLARIKRKMIAAVLDDPVIKPVQETQSAKL